MSSRLLDKDDEIDLSFFNKTLNALKQMHISGIVHRTLKLDYMYIKGERVKILHGRKTGSIIKESDEWEDYHDLVMAVYPRMKPELIFQVIDILSDLKGNTPILAIRIWADDIGLRKQVDEYIKERTYL